MGLQLGLQLGLHIHVFQIQPQSTLLLKKQQKHQKRHQTHAPYNQSYFIVNKRKQLILNILCYFYEIFNFKNLCVYSKRITPITIAIAFISDL